MVLDFFTKASELILQNRLSTADTVQSILNRLINPNPLKFQLCFEQKFNFSSLIPLQWNLQLNKLLVIEFFLQAKFSDSRYLVEQWIFDISQVSNNKLEYTIDSITALYTKLSVLLRTISLLTVTLPLYKKYTMENIKDTAEFFRLEHSINFFTTYTLKLASKRT